MSNFLPKESGSGFGPCRWVELATRGTRRVLAAGCVIVLCSVTGAASSATAAAGSPSPGAVGIGDALFPTLGNGGYDVEHYRLDLRYPTAAPTEPFQGTVVITARATQALSQFNLDWGGGPVGAVRVNGRPAAWQQAGEELVVRPSKPLADGRRFLVRVQDYTITPLVLGDEPPGPGVAVASPDGTVWFPQPARAHYGVPSNDHPRDKATWTFRLDVPAGTTAVANGLLTGRRRHGRRVVWHYLQRQPMATELMQIAVGRFDLTYRADVHGIRIRDVTPPALSGALLPLFAHEREHLVALEEVFGPYPFDVYGTLGVDLPILFAVENQGLTTVTAELRFAGPEGWATTMVHETAHQWMGDSVSVSTYADIWLSEGHATFYELLFADAEGLMPQARGAASLDEYMHLLYDAFDAFREAFGPVASPLNGDWTQPLNNNVYEGGALVLYALREHIGVAAFARLERQFAQRFAGRSVGTSDFIALASQVSGHDQGPFLRAWLYGTTTPPMPGRPDW